ncbi:hypothetical protein Poli38472_003328 [Pythium oligandrum]|uniref:FPL domain-containing protein n=1 Tax=Pythium oligandrum TaxID=41045 RepID=A0A8K1FG32_PYTOL|nr:hypothetical protein Poli38472_003328 [Pythium oligandrum]|eukprot:TMW57403.1 hypothetical protein Poli38472_003328 [Pythium oligandrum]
MSMWTWLLGGGSASHKAHGRLSGFLSGAGSVKRDFTLSNMQHLHLQLVKYPDLPDAEIVEVLRVLSEFLIYSDQNRSDSPNSPQMLESIAFEATTASAGVFFDYFCEKNILGLLVELGESKPSVAVQIQLLQTLSLLVQNIATRTSLYYILSNNYVNKLLECPFAYDTDDDVRDWYVTLLKALSLRLNEDTVQFFFNTSNQSFPLYVQALRFGRCSETMIKVAVKTLMLNVLRVQDERVRRFLLEYQDMAYFQDIVEYANEMALKIQGLMNIWTPTATAAMTDKLEEAVDSYIDHCFYLQDILDVNLPELCYRVGEAIYSRHVRDFLAVSILPNCHLPPQRVSTRLALYLLTRLLGILEHAPLVNAISFLLLSPDAHLGCDYSTVALGAGARRRSVRTVKKSKGKSKKKKRKKDEFLDFGKTKFPVALNLKSSSPYEFLVPLSMPGKTLAERKATLAIRSPVNEMELCRKSMRVFLTLRRMRDLVDVKYADDKFDELTAFRHPHTEALAVVRPSRTTNNITEAVDLEGMVFLKCMWREQRFLPTPAKLLMVLNPEALAFVEKDDQHRTKDKEYGFVRLFAPIHRAYATIDAKDELVLHFTISSPGPVEGCRSYHKSKTKDSQVDSLKRWHVSVLFENSEDCRQAKAHVDLSRAEVRAHKLLKIEESLTAHVQITASNAALRESEQRDSTLTNEDSES